MKTFIFSFAFIAVMLVGFTSIDGGVNSVFATSTATSTTPIVEETSSYCYLCSNGVVVESNYNIRQVEDETSSMYGLAVANYMTSQWMTSSIEITDEGGYVVIVTNHNDGERAGIINGLVSYHTIEVYLPIGGTYSIRPMSIWKGIYTSYGRYTTLTIK